MFCILLVTLLLVVYVKVNHLIPGKSVIAYMWIQDIKTTGIDTTSGVDNNSGIYTSGCVIPNIDPWHESILTYTHNMSQVQCTDRPLFYAEGNILRFNRTTVNNMFNGKPPRCGYKVLTRQDSDKKCYISNETIVFQKDLKVNDEFIFITCYDDTNTITGIYLQAFVLLKPEVELRCAQTQQESSPSLSADGTTPPNVLMFGIDSVSLLNFMRQMPETRRLLHSLGGVELKGYHKVHDNTLVNMMPMWHGTFLQELNWSREQHFDQYDLIWNHFSRSGYRTLLVEDYTEIDTFNYQKAGFHKQPTDYYMRPFLMVLEKLIFSQHSSELCYEGKHQLVTILDYLDDFLELFTDMPHFASVFFNLLSHNDINTIGKADQIIKTFIRKLFNVGKLTNTFLLFYSDHGLRFGQFRDTYVGYHEERLPMFVILTPEWFRRRYPDLQKNLKVNSQRLVTPFDIHATLHNILGSPYTASPQRGISIFKVIPENRTCLEASIGINWCMCYPHIPVNVTEDYVVEAANAIVKYMNEAIADEGYKHKCAILTLAGVHSAHIIDYRNYVHRNIEITYKSNLHEKKGRNGEKALVLAIEVKPSRKIYQTTVIVQTVNGVSYEVWDFVGVISKNGNGHSCYGMIEASKYCYCLL